MSHGGGCCPGEVVVQRASESLVLIESGVLQGLVEAGNCPLVHFLVQPVAAVNPHDRGLVAMTVGVRGRSTECLGPVRGETFSVLRMVSVAERMADNFVLQHARVPRVREFQQSLDATSSFINRLHGQFPS